jgi:hypothetical protein
MERRENTMSIHDELVACIQRADEAARAKEYRRVLMTLEHAEFKAALLAKEGQTVQVVTQADIDKVVGL